MSQSYEWTQASYLTCFRRLLQMRRCHHVRVKGHILMNNASYFVNVVRRAAGTNLELHEDRVASSSITPNPGYIL